MRIVLFITDAIGASDIQKTLHITVSHVEKITRDQISVADAAQLVCAWHASDTITGDYVLDVIIG